MDQEPWGLSGEQFLQIFWIGVLCALALAAAIRILPKFLGRGNHGVWRPAAVPIGFLAAGPDRAVQAAAAELLANGALRAESTGLVRATGQAVVPSPLAAQILARATASHTLKEINRYLRSRSTLWNVGHELADLGLLVPAHIAARFRYGSTVPLLAVLLVGIVRLANGFGQHRPVAFLVLSLLGTIVLLVCTLNFQRNRHLRTLAGDRALRELRRATVRDAATAVALDGVSAYPDARIAAALRKSVEPGRRRTPGGIGAAAAGGYFWGGGGGCGSSGGGGSSCGGGGGGCGGGGGGCGG